MVNVPTPEFQKFWSNSESLRLDNENNIQHDDADVVMEREHGHCPPGGMYPCISQRKSEMDS
jgi:hypothetical protein